MAKKNIRKTPKFVSLQLNRLNERYVVAACLKTYSTEQLFQGELKHLGIELNSGGINVPREPILPPKTSGKYSKINITGREVVRKDLPKETHYTAIESPNYGDWYNGSHTVNLPYEKYPRDFIGPEYVRIKVTANKANNQKGRYITTFEVDKVLDRKDPNFNSDLLTCLNILQENVGKCGVQKAGASLNDYLQTTRVDWEILPPGTREEVVERIFAGRKSPISQEEKKVAGDRYDFFKKLKAKKLIFGTSGLQRYFGALLKDDLVVFENIEYGNAVYIMYDDWQKLSKRTRTELLTGRYGKQFDRVPHISGWKTKVKRLVKKSQA